MELADYFQNVKGTGILATCDADGSVNAAIYARPYVINKQTVAFSMMEHMTYANIQSNPKACYMFIEQTEGYRGLRLYLTKQKEETDIEKIKEIKRMHNLLDLKPDKKRHLVYFKINSTRPLVGEASSDSKQGKQ